MTIHAANKRLLVISEPRTGSNNLINCLNQHPHLKIGNELLHPKNGIKPEEYNVTKSDEFGSGEFHWITYVDKESFVDIINDLFRRFNGFKIHSQHIPENLIIDIVKELNCDVIITQRRNLFNQAISNFIAVHKSLWHADEKNKVEVNQPFKIDPKKFINWIEFILNARKRFHRALSMFEEKKTPFIVEYEAFYSGSFEQKIVQLNFLFDKLDLTRIGQFPKEQSKDIYKRLKYFLDPDKQKLTSKLEANKIVSNYDELALTYALWKMESYNSEVFY